MNSRELELLRLMQAFKIAFLLSPFAKHGDTGRGRFLLKWVPHYIKQQTGTHKKEVKQLFKRCKTADSYLFCFRSLERELNHLTESLEEHEHLNDYERLVKCLNTFSKQWNLTLKWDVAPENMNDTCAVDEDTIIIPSQITGKYNQTIPPKIALPLGLISRYKETQAELVKSLSSYGFGITAIKEFRGFSAIMITSAAVNVNVKTLLKKSA